MNNKNKINQITCVEASKLIKRKSFVKFIFGSLASLGISSLSKEEKLAEASSNKSFDLTSLLPAGYEKFPIPTYIPSNYKLREIYTDRPDGFGIGSKQLCYCFINYNHQLGMFNHLLVYVASKAKSSTLTANENHTSRKIRINTSSQVEGNYFDGWWFLTYDTRLASQDSITINDQAKLIWDDSNVHSITFDLKDFKIGVRGARLVNIDYSELLKIASSIN